MILGQRQALGLAIDGGGGAEHETAHATLRHRLQQGDRAADVVLVVRERLLDRFADRFPRREVHDGLHLLRAQEIGDGRLVAHVGAAKGDADVPREGSQALEHARLGIAEVVDDHRSIAGRGE